MWGLCGVVEGVRGFMGGWGDGGMMNGDAGDAWENSIYMDGGERLASSRDFWNMEVWAMGGWSGRAETGLLLGRE